MRSILFDYPQNQAAKDISDEFMFGDSLLVCPVISPMSVLTERECYLPGGSNWFDFWTGELIKGGQYIRKKVELDKSSLFVKAGSIILIKRDIQFANPKTDIIELHIYPGSDCVSTLYDDEGDGYGYEKGKYSLIKMKWDNVNATLTIKGELFSQYSCKIKMVWGNIQEILISK